MIYFVYLYHLLTLIRLETLLRFNEKHRKTITESLACRYSSNILYSQNSELSTHVAYNQL
jgi:hypothetical protein